jgi:hypothetical protein
MMCERRYASPPAGTRAKKLPVSIVTRGSTPRAFSKAGASRSSW